MQYITVCSNISVRSIYTSDKLYTTETLPKEMCFKLPKQTDSYSMHYNWYPYPQKMEALYNEE